MTVKSIFKKAYRRVFRKKKMEEPIRYFIEEPVWAHTFHDTIKDRAWLRDLAISPGRWAGNYSFFYVLVRILQDYQPKRIIEFGLGESSKVVSVFLKNTLSQSIHLVIEQNEGWVDAFQKRFELNNQTDILHFPLTEKVVNDYRVKSYDGLEEKVKEKFDFYLIDGPFGSGRYSRFQIYNLAKLLDNGDEFIILLDDFNREGEKDTAKELESLFKSKGINIFRGEYHGSKSQVLYATEKYKFATSF